MFELNSDISIGRYRRVKPSMVKITKSMFEYVDKAVITIPAKARLQINNPSGSPIVGDPVESSKFFEEGDKVTILLGYNGRLEQEFDGFITRLNFTVPLEIECEGYSYLLRKKTYNKAFKQAKLIDVLRFIVAGTPITLASDTPDFLIEKLLLQNHSGTEALEMIKKISANTIRIFFTGNVLYAGLQFLKPLSDVKYRLGWNVIKDGQLKLRQAKNQDVQINIVGLKKDGTTVKVTSGRIKDATTVGSSGTFGETKIIKTHAITDLSTLKAMADEKYKQLSFDGYEGKITTFLQPFCSINYRAILNDLKYPERSGNYIVESVEVTYSTNGARRVLGIGAKL